MNGDGAEAELPRPPFESLRERLMATAHALRETGHGVEADSLDGIVQTWWSEQLGWNEAIVERLRLVHEINNALVGVKGNAQLMLLGPVKDVPDARTRLETILREASRIKDAAARLREIRRRIEDVAEGRSVA